MSFQRMATVHLAVSLVRLSPFQALWMHITFHRIERISPDKEHIFQMRNGQKRMRTYTNGWEIFVLRQMSVNAIR